MTNEGFYDTEIAPKMRELARQCEERGMSFVASVEFAPGETGETATIREDAGFKTRLTFAAMIAHGNVDSLFFWLIKHAKTHGHQSLVLQQLGVAHEPDAGALEVAHQ
jgi:hypothetical protein